MAYAKYYADALLHMAADGAKLVANGLVLSRGLLQVRHDG